MNKVFLAGIGFTKIGDLWDKSLKEIAIEVGSKAITNSGTSKIEQLIIGNMFSSHSSSQEHLGALIGSELGLNGIPAFKVEAACASGGAAVNVGYSLIKSGLVDSVLVIGVEKMMDLEPNKIVESISMAENAEFTQFFGATFTMLNAMLAKLYMEKYEVTKDQLSAFSVLAHENATMAEHAQFKKKISFENIEKSPIISDPLTLLDCAPFGDGAAALVLVNEKKAAEVKDKLVEISSSIISTNRFSIYERDDMLEFSATRNAFNLALSKAGASIKDLDFMEIHDAYTILAALSIEAMNISKKGEACRDAKRGCFNLNGELPINTFGGLKARGNPIGATGVYQIAEAYLQLTNQAGKNQIEDAELGMTQNLGGIDTTSVIHILKRSS